ncbi:BlaI/MecI/CopY family transcriptional regulator [Kitasatospora sp. NPDC059803]|uniref:BlaI/MecI/CopY family transcriptional regulator n=1 Tax=Kitasatospora sp. NPDC059803 TaxID=3346953 RepID=UPI0036571E15
MRVGRDARRPHGELVADVLAVLWAAGEPLTAQQVKEALDHGLARTTVTTILTRLHEKGTLVRSRPARSFAYAPVEDAAGLAAGRMRRELEKEPQRDLVLKRFVSSLSEDDEDVLRRLLLDAQTEAEAGAQTGARAATAADSGRPGPEDDAWA